MTEFAIVDVFAEQRWAGNPLAVVLDCDALAESELQPIAREFDYSETTFVRRELRERGHDVRIFTPSSEIPFAGHPTLGTAAVLRALRGAGDRVLLHLGVGPVEVVFEDEVAWMRPPPPRLAERVPGPEAAALLGLDETDLAADRPAREAAVGIGFVLVPLADRQALGHARLDLARLRARRASRPQETGVLAFACDGPPERPIAARMFFEAAGMAREDPATGSANTCLGAYLLEHGLPSGGAHDTGAERDTLETCVEQGVEMGRPSLLRIRARCAPEGHRVAVGGRCVLSARGELLR